MIRPSRVLVPLTTLLLSAGCASSNTAEAPVDTTATTTATPKPTDATTATSNATTTAGAATGTSETPPAVTVAEVELPSTPAGDQLRWVLDQATNASDAEFELRFSDTFLANPGIDVLRTGVAEIGAIILNEVVSSTPNELVVVVDAASEELALTITVEAEPPHRIIGLSAQPTTPPQASTTWAAIDSTLSNAAAQFSYLAAEVSADGNLVTVNASEETNAVPLGSSFKIYVLGAVVTAIAAGELAWDDELTIRDELKSLPSGEMQNLPDGTTVTVQQAAEKMIQISDNTATDLLINRLGRDRVEAMLPIMGMGVESQQRTLPFITTRELFTLKWGVGSDRLAAYAAADVEQRRVLLGELATEPLPGVADFVADVPLAIDSVEWFATPPEIGAAHIWLDAYRTTAGFEPLAVILGDNPGVPLDPAVWPESAFKGGSEPGVIFLGWLLHRADGRTFVVVVSATNPDAPVDEAAAVSAAQGIISLLE